MSEMLNAVDALLSRPADLPPPQVRRALREADGLTQAEVAHALGIARISFLAWEKGQSRPRGERLSAYARLLNGWAVKHPHVASLPPHVDAR
jgi:DNA-binding transcriptional regulator YiaG